MTYEFFYVKFNHSLHIVFFIILVADSMLGGNMNGNCSSRSLARAFK